MKILSAEQIRKWDEFTILNEPISSIDLMERAARQCTQWFEQKKGGFRKIRIFCGKGNNGGDGLAIARQLVEKDILSDVYILEFGSLGTNDFQTNLSRLHSFPVTIHFIQHQDFFPVIDKADLIIDALFGSGLNRPLDGLSLQLVQHLNKSAATIIAIDLPSGMFADKPSPTNAVIKAHETLTFQQLKFCFLFPENEPFFGEVHVLNIGLHPDFSIAGNSMFELTDWKMIKEIYKPRKQFSHKGTYGHALIVAGEKGKMGAAVLCTRGCLRSGAGLVSAMVPEEQFAIIQTAVPEAMAIAQETIETVDLSKYTTVGIGPGTGTSEESARLLQRVLVNYNRPIVIDADGLNIIAANDELLSELPPGSILSPHPKEFERIFGKTENHLERIQTARLQAQKLFVYIIVKGHYSFVACPDGEVYFNSTGNSGMATGGSGDVLTGILTGLLAQGYSAKESCLLGMFLHGLSADIAVKTTSQEALVAGDITEYLGKAFLSIAN
ncbi:NAD(P)H-hydrate dehydratase [Segetibacter aerophilus]|uniref:Bifunctional NAD(P)H-hydrate repair enzyme n=1 Tax=Segetibacter aerophilus TaxID=670293 RepID=A0A512BGN6_9BACT|nr:NAD(P)H-hydrate dehydratase [Segetibacter aerophilus]GEO11130.1 bifunctional NAD(P)H-hydrate repair enzyme [Segetibacter aerophilus]